MSEPDPTLLKQIKHLEDRLEYLELTVYQNRKETEAKFAKVIDMFREDWRDDDCK
jgi:hypothetical protein